MKTTRDEDLLSLIDEMNDLTLEFKACKSSRKDTPICLIWNLMQGAELSDEDQFEALPNNAFLFQGLSLDLYPSIWGNNQETRQTCLSTLQRIVAPKSQQERLIELELPDHIGQAFSQTDHLHHMSCLDRAGAICSSIRPK